MHLFRDCVATSIAIRDPKHVHVAAAVLGHSCLATTERYYSLASATEAATDYHQVLDSYRQGD